MKPFILRLLRAAESASRFAARGFVDLVLPPLCGACLAPDPGSDISFLCGKCRGGLLLSDPSRQCIVCGVEADSLALVEGRCGKCLRRRPPYDRLVAAAPYAEPLRSLITRMKYGQDRPLLNPLGQLFASVVGPAIGTPDVILPLPLSRKRERERGFNQSEFLSEALGRRFGLLPLRGTIVRTRHVPPQASLALSERRRNVSGSFRLVHPHRVYGRHVVLVDDVVTTGSTLIEAATTLREGSPFRVTLAVLARA
jgi:ComF family protein